MYPEKVVSYIKENEKSLISTVYIEMDQHMLIESFGGNFEKLDLELPKKRTKLADTYSFIEGIDFQEGCIEIPRIQIAQEKWVDVAFIQEDATCLLIITASVITTQEFAAMMQKNNEGIISQDSGKVLGSASVLAEVLHLLDYMVWVEESVGYRLKSYPSKWFLKLFPDKERQLFYDDLSELFPYLDAFLPDAQQVWQSVENKHKDSELWTESTEDGDEIYLQAIAAKENDRKYLILGTHNLSSEQRRQLIQKARENSLAQEQLQKTEAKLRTLLQFKDQFVSVVSHDLRSPLAGVVNALDMMIKDEAFQNGLSDLGKEFMSEIKSELSKVLDYNQKLYHWSNLELGRFKLNKKLLSVEELLQSLQNRFKSNLESKSIKLDVKINTSFSFAADEALFTQVLNNILQNAIKFSPLNSTITIHTAEEDSGNQIVVTDQGSGIPEKIQQGLFKGVAQNHAEGTAGEKGTGLGLSITKNILDAHQMSIDFKTNTSGTSFYIHIPH